MFVVFVRVYVCLLDIVQRILYVSALSTAKRRRVMQTRQAICNLRSDFPVGPVDDAGVVVASRNQMFSSNLAKSLSHLPPNADCD